MIGKYAVTIEHIFVVLDSPESCPRCQRQTLALFDSAKVCSRCAGVWAPVQRAGMIAAIRRPFPTNPKPRWAPPRKEDKEAEVRMLVEALRQPKNNFPGSPDATVLEKRGG